MIKAVKSFFFPKYINANTGDTSYKPSWALRKMRFRYDLGKGWRHFKRQIKLPICLIKGHATYESHDWGGGYLKCSRCNLNNVLWLPKTIRSNIK